MPPTSTLFSFGPGFSFECDTATAVGNVYLAIEYNSLNGLRTVYVDGKKYSTSTFSNSLFGKVSSSFKDSAYIGLNYVGADPGLSASIDEFRVWSGVLPVELIYSHYITGVDESHIHLSYNRFVCHISRYNCSANLHTIIR